MTHKHPISDHDYRSSIGIPQSTLKGFAKCPAYVRWLEQEHKRPPTESQALGLMVEHLLFGIAFRHAISPFDSFKTNEAKAWKAEQQANNITVLTQKAADEAAIMVEALHRNPEVEKLIAHGRPSVALFGEHKATGLLRKGLLDFVPDDQFILDLKTSQDPSEFGFGRQVASYRYDVQAASYSRLFEDVFNEKRTFVFIVVSNKEPFLTATYYLRPDQIASAEAQYEYWMKRYAECDAADHWPGYTSALTALNVPKYIEIPVEPL